MGAELAVVAKDRFTALDTLALGRELRALGPVHVDKVFDAGADAWTVLLRGGESRRQELHLVAGRYGSLLSRGAPRGEELSPLAQRLRRTLSGSRLATVHEPGGERLLDIELSRSDAPEPLRLIVEFFGAGNLILARGGTIVALAHPRRFAARELRVGVEYAPPPSRANPWTLTIAELTAALSSSRTDRASTLAARLAFGGPIAEEILARSGLPGSVPASERAGEAAAKLRLAIDSLLADMGDPPAGYLYTKDGALLDVEPFPSVRWSETAGVTVERLDRFSDAAERYFTELLAPKEQAVAVDPRRGELERQIQQQESAIEALVAESNERRTLAETLLAHYAEAEARLASAEAEGKAGPVTELVVGALTIPLLAGRTVRESAQALFEESKRARAKLEATREALLQSRARLDRLGAAPPTGGPRVTEAAPERRRRHWFERYRWFLSSEGVLVIGGRDAASNDLIVRRYLGERDFYVHADIHGAASVIVRHPAPGQGDVGGETLREAAQWALAYSKAWRAGHASGDAFWVTAEQVSKAAASGEFVPRGAWVIHGTKNILRDLPLELGIGTVRYEEETLWSVAPPQALRARGELRFLLVPGDERERAEKEISLARELGLSRSVLQSLLPSGGFEARRA